MVQNHLHRSRLQQANSFHLIVKIVEFYPCNHDGISANLLDWPPMTTTLGKSKKICALVDRVVKIRKACKR